ncbi:3'-5' exonuclease [Candidatus Woesearchaeota archaeon]|nr:3'-5' exonuclease [Candidatus Woesearchaeota archaeon]
MEYVVVDIETTGLSRYRHKITEIAAVRYNGKKMVDEFQSLVNPEVRIPRFITRLTGIDDELVKDAPKIPEVMQGFMEWLGDSTIVAHNASFDYGFLRHNAELLGEELSNDRLCTRKLANRLLPDMGSKKLCCLCDHFEIVNEQAHRAMGDVKATAHIFHNFQDMLAEIGIECMEKLKSFEKAPRRRG